MTATVVLVNALYAWNFRESFRQYAKVEYKRQNFFKGNVLPYASEYFHFSNKDPLTIFAIWYKYMNILYVISIYIFRWFQKSI